MIVGSEHYQRDHQVRQDTPGHCQSRQPISSLAPRRSYADSPQGQTNLDTGRSTGQDMVQASDTGSSPESLQSLNNEVWSMSCSQSGIQAPTSQFLEVSNLLLEQVQLNSSHLFRADVLQDTIGKLKTIQEKEARCDLNIDAQIQGGDMGSNQPTLDHSWPSLPLFNDFKHQRTVVRRLVPRKPQLDKSLDQSCFIYYDLASQDSVNPLKTLVVYVPHCQSEDLMPWYHPKVRALAYLFTTELHTSTATISIHYLPFPTTPTPLPDRLYRTFNSLLQTIIRLLKLPSKPANQSTSASESLNSDTITSVSLTASSLKDTILPQHIVQNTYSRLKQSYASDLIARWIEKTEPSKHVFEDLSIAAFLIELWNTMYTKDTFPGFVDIACGNGVLVYILNSEGWKGSGFDARRRKTWEVLECDKYIEEKVLIPKPFLEKSNTNWNAPGEMAFHDGIFSKGTFIISNHADELTCWTPILAALSSPENPLPFLAIPCCSHALDGSRKRYSIKDVAVSTRNTTENSVHKDHEEANGDLNAMRAAKQKTNSHADDKSMYACLTRKTAALAQELGIEVELTLMRIPSTRNIGIVGNRKKIRQTSMNDIEAGMNGLGMQDPGKAEMVEENIEHLLERECASIGGIETSARTWIEKARKLQGGQGRGKVNWNGPIEHASVV